MNEKIAKAFADEMKKLGIAPVIAAAGKLALRAAPQVAATVAPSLLGGRPKPPKMPLALGGLK